MSRSRVVAEDGASHRVILVNLNGDSIWSKARDRNFRFGDMTWTSTEAWVRATRAKAPTASKGK